MARGWESKSVEGQIESAASAETHNKVPLTREQMQWEHDREVIEMHRTRTLHDLENATNPRYRALLETTIQHLDSVLADLDRAKPA